MVQELECIAGTTLIKTVTGKPATISYTESEINAIFNTIPNSVKATLRFQLESNIGGTLSYRNFSKTLEIKKEEVRPIFSDFDISDVNAITTALTGDNSKMIKSYSKMEVKIPVSKKATAQKGASITRYVITTGNSSSGDISYSTTADRSYTFNNVLVNTVRVTAYDSRKLETTVSKTFTLINYTNPIIENAELSRVNGVETTSELGLSGKFDKVNFGAVQNVITTAEYRKRIGSGEWSEWADINALITYNTENGTFKHGSMNTITGFDFGKEYEVEVRIGDKLRKVTSTAIVNSGKVLLSYDKENHRIGIGTVPFGNEEGIYITDKVYGLEHLEHEESERVGRNFNQVVKFPEGTMIQTMSFLVGASSILANSTSVITVPFTENFYDIPCVTVTGFLGNSTHGRAVNININGALNQSESDVQVAITHNNTTSYVTAVHLNIIAIGRWR